MVLIYNHADERIAAPLTKYLHQVQEAFAKEIATWRRFILLLLRRIIILLVLGQPLQACLRLLELLGRHEVFADDELELVKSLLTSPAGLFKRNNKLDEFFFALVRGYEQLHLVGVATELKIHLLHFTILHELNKNIFGVSLHVRVRLHDVLFVFNEFTFSDATLRLAHER